MNKLPNYLIEIFIQKIPHLDLLFEDIGHDRYYDALVDKYTSSNQLKPILQKLKTRSLLKISINLLMAHIAPLLNRTYVRKGESNATELVLKNLIKWSKEFPNSIENLNKQRIQLAEWSQQQSGFEWESPLMKQLGMNALMTQPLLDILLDRQPNHNCDKGLLFDLLSRFHSVRYWQNMKDICNYIKQKIKEKERGFPFKNAISFFFYSAYGIRPLSTA